MISGQIETRPLPVLLYQLLQQRFTGEIAVQTETGAAQLYLTDGALVREIVRHRAIAADPAPGVLSPPIASAIAQSPVSFRSMMLSRLRWRTAPTCVTEVDRHTGSKEGVGVGDRKAAMGNPLATASVRVMLDQQVCFRR